MDSKRWVRVAAALTFAIPLAWVGAYYAGMHWIPKVRDSLPSMGGFDGPSEPLLPPPLPEFWGELPAEEQSTVVARLSGFRTQGEEFVIFLAAVEDPLNSSYRGDKCSSLPNTTRLATLSCSATTWPPWK